MEELTVRTPFSPVRSNTVRDGEPMKKKNVLRAVLTVIPPLILLSYFLIGFVKLGFYGQKVFVLTPFHLLISTLNVTTREVILPWPTYLLSLLLFASVLFAWLMLLLKKNLKWVALGLLGAGIFCIGLMISLSMLGDTVAKSGGALGRLVYIPLESFGIILIAALLGSLIALLLQSFEKFFESIFLLFAIVAVVSVVIITGFMIAMGAPAIAQIGIVDFLFNTVWKPTGSSTSYGIGAMILTTIYATAGSILIGAPIGVLTAVFLSEFAPPKAATVIRSAINLLAGIPSVIYGFFGLLVIVPLIRDLFGILVGDSLLAVILILSIMILPTVISITETSLRAVPSALKEASLGLGATHIQTIFKVLIPTARSGIFAGLILGVGRAIGETMAVIMVAGNVVNMPELLSPVRPMTAGIVLEMAYSSDLHRQALFAIGLILFLFIMLVNIAFRRIMKKAGEKIEA